MSRVCKIVIFLCFVAVCEYVSGNVISSKDLKEVNTKELPIEKEVEDDFKVIPIEATPEKPAEKCAPIGSFCMNHSDCCSNSCLGYMKRCVSGTG
ncbi:conotoxin ArMKLT2-032-like [Ostrinia furnacalis]|uniref:conotoxin ArMKLT2-032-like n=1 Tax=Ostrinia furnacalis TaxID=93504 RepID=UPI00103A372C|nr:conotoxin ArMKLT2-032-like [Ostrinia furnacalis]